MTPSRETIAVALFTLLQTASGFNTFTRRPLDWDEVPISQMPALLMGQLPDKYDYRNGTLTPPIITLVFDCFIYISSDPNTQAAVTPDTTLNNLKDAVESVLGGFAYTGQKQTLGGLIDHCWIEEEIHRAAGYKNGKGMSWFVINAVVPS